jgi:hypothetical protein
MKYRKYLMLFSVLATSGYSGLTAASLLNTYAGGVGGTTNGSIANGCYTNGTPNELQPFFRGGAFPSGGISACGLTGGLVQNSGTAGPVTSSFTLAPVKVGGPNNPKAGYYSGQANATASYGSLAVSAQGKFQNGIPDGSPGTYDNTVAAAMFTDTLTPTSALITNGSAGFIRYAFDLQGTASALGNPAAYYQGETYIQLLYKISTNNVQLGWSPHVSRGDLGTIGGTVPAGWTTSTGSLSGESIFYSMDLPIFWGQSFDMTVGLVATAYGEASADFLGTAKLTGVQLFDSNHIQVTNFNLLAASDTNYVATVAEPETYTMLLAALGILGFVERRKKIISA